MRRRRKRQLQLMLKRAMLFRFRCPVHPVPVQSCLPGCLPARPSPVQPSRVAGLDRLFVAGYSMAGPGRRWDEVKQRAHEKRRHSSRGAEEARGGWSGADNDPIAEQDRMLDSTRHQMGRPMLVPPWAVELDPKTSLYVVRLLWSRREGLCGRALLCFAAARGRLHARLHACMLAWPSGEYSEYAALP